MKKTGLLLLLLAFTFTSCDKDLTDVSFTTNISATSDDIVVNDTSLKSNSNNYSVEFDVSLENDDTREYLDRIKELEFEKIDLFFNGLESLAGNQTPTNLKITVNNDIVFKYNDFIYDTVASGEAFKIDDMDKLNQVAKLLLDNKSISVRIEGEIPDVDYHQFNISINGTAKITAKAL